MMTMDIMNRKNFVYDQNDEADDPLVDAETHHLIKGGRSTNVHLNKKAASSLM